MRRVSQAAPRMGSRNTWNNAQSKLRCCYVNVYTCIILLVHNGTMRKVSYDVSMLICIVMRQCLHMYYTACTQWNNAQSR
jgi:hypothetical protein